MRGHHPEAVCATEAFAGGFHICHCSSTNDQALFSSTSSNVEEDGQVISIGYCPPTTWLEYCNYNLPHDQNIAQGSVNQRRRREGDSAGRSARHDMVSVIVIKYSPNSMDVHHPYPLHLLTKDGSHECLSQADSACSTLSPTAAALMEHHMMENNLDQVVGQDDL